MSLKVNASTANRFIHLNRGVGAVPLKDGGNGSDLKTDIPMEVKGSTGHENCTVCANTKFCTNYVTTTKYKNWFVFLPQNLFEQFQKKANFYFLIIAILSCTPLSPKTPIVSIAPLVFVLFVSALKECLEDINRKKMDTKVNNTLVQVWRDGAFVDITWANIRVGDIVRVTRDQPFPADICLLSTGGEQGSCSIETANLDGETNLKVKKSARETYTIQSQDGQDFPQKLPTCLLESCPPSKLLEKWTYPKMVGAWQKQRARASGNRPASSTRLYSTQYQMDCWGRCLHWRKYQARNEYLAWSFQTLELGLVGG